MDAEGSSGLHTLIGLGCVSCLLIHQRPQMERSIDSEPNNPEQYHLSIGGRRVYCCLFLPTCLFMPLLLHRLLFILMWSRWSSWWWHGVDYAVPTVTYSKGGRGRRHCCLWSVDDSPACCTSSTLATSWWEGSRTFMQGHVRCMPSVVSPGFQSEITTRWYLVRVWYFCTENVSVMKQALIEWF